MKSSMFSIGFGGISQLGSAFIFLRWFKLAHICIQVTSLHKWKKQGINHKFLIGNQFHITLRTGVWNVEKANTRSEKVNNLKTAMKKTAHTRPRQITYCILSFMQ